MKKAGGRFRFVTLIQRRMRDLQRGAPPLVERSDSLLETAVGEYQQGKIWPVQGEEAEKLRKERASRAPPRLPSGQPGAPQPSGGAGKPAG